MPFFKPDVSLYCIKRLDENIIIEEKNLLSNTNYLLRHSVVHSNPVKCNCPFDLGLKEQATRDFLYPTDVMLISGFSSLRRQRRYKRNARPCTSEFFCIKISNGKSESFVKNIINKIIVLTRFLNKYTRVTRETEIIFHKISKLAW